MEKVTGLGDLTRRDGEVQFVETIFGIRDWRPAKRRQDRDSGLRLCFCIPAAQTPHRSQPQDRRSRVDVPAKKVPYFKRFKGITRPGESGRSEGVADIAS